MSRSVFLIDKFVPEEHALIHFRDLAIQRGYGVFDFFKVVDGSPVFFEDHLRRFYFSAEQMGLNVGFKPEELKNIISELLQKNGVPDTGIRITLTGGYSDDGYQPAKPNMVISLHSFKCPTREQYERGIKLLSYQHQRQLPHVKTIDYLMAIWLQPFIRQRNTDDVLYHQNGIITECPRSNFFMVTENNTIVTPAAGILKGIVRTKLMEMARDEGFKTEERDVSLHELASAREAFITSTTKTILPVRQIDELVLAAKNSVADRLSGLMHELQSTAPTA